MGNQYGIECGSDGWDIHNLPLECGKLFMCAIYRATNLPNYTLERHARDTPEKLQAA
jgi:hypothetical protein